MKEPTLKLSSEFCGNNGKTKKSSRIKASTMSSHGTNAPNLDKDEEEMFPEVSSFFSIICSSVVKSKLNNIKPKVLKSTNRNIEREKQLQKGEKEKVKL